MLESSDRDTLFARAEHYRSLAGGPVPWSVVQQLEKLAEECEREASTLATQRWRG
jgi:hypothetical protein